MDIENKIEQLLEAFYNGYTTPEEEAMLSEYLNSDNIDERRQTDKDIFNALYDTADIPLPEGMTERLETAIDKHIAETSEQKGKKISFNRLYVAISSAAAVVLLCVALFFATEKQSQTNYIADTFSDPKEAALAAEQALLFVSNKLNQGLSPLEKVTESVDKTNKLLNETITINE
jgi:hypothetical protein